jgi:prepilin-type N-terminal cleavage/methylation domain-containing protein
MSMTRLRDDRGFTLVELLVASVVTVIVLGGAVALTSQIQNGYRRQIEGSAAEQEGRYALDWIGRYVRGAANNPNAATTTDCPDNGTLVAAVQFDPDADGIDDDVRLMTDANPPDGLFGGSAGDCTQANEDVTISHDSENNTIVFLDNNTGGAVSTRTDTVIEDLRFVFRNSAHAVLDTTVANPANVIYVETRITIRTRTIDPSTGQPTTRTLSSEIRVRSRT